MDARIREETQSVKASELSERKQRGATRAQLGRRAQLLTGPAAQQIAEYNAACWKQQRDERVARRIARMLNAVRP